MYAGRAREISARAAVPQLVAYAERGSLLEQASAIPPSYDLPVFAGIPGGMGRLAEALASGAFEVRTGATVRAMRGSPAAPGPAGFVLVVGPTNAEELVEADAVVLATPAAPTARLLADVAPAASAELAAIESASVAVVTLAFRAADLAEAIPGDSSGFLVPPTEGRRIKASTFSFAKWGWVREAGAGRPRRRRRASTCAPRWAGTARRPPSRPPTRSWSPPRWPTWPRRSGLTARPVDTHVQRWGGGLPQYALGHLDRVARIRADVARVPGLAVCGASYDGVGIPAVIASAHRAAARPRVGLTCAR